MAFTSALGATNPALASTLTTESDITSETYYVIVDSRTKLKRKMCSAEMIPTTEHDQTFLS